MLVHINKIVRKADRRGYAIGAFNTSNLEMTLAIARAAAKAKSPLIIQTSESAIAYAGLKTIFNIIKSVAETDAKTIPVAVHLDHGKNWEIIKDCIAMGYSSVHFDGSLLPFSQNLKMAKRAAEYGHKRGVWVQGELGSIAGKEGMAAKELPSHVDYTDPERAREFAARSGIDTLAVSVGTIHGSFKGIEKIRHDLIREIKRHARLPLVLHGASGNSREDIRKAVAAGISIVNIDTDLRIAFTDRLQKELKEKIRFYDPRKFLAPATEAASDEVGEKISYFGSVNKL